MELAAFLRMPLYKLMDEMPYCEYMRWVQYMKERPPSRQADYRAAMIMSSFGGKIQMEKIFPSLKPYKPPKLSSSLKNSKAFKWLLNAVGGTQSKDFYEN